MLNKIQPYIYKNAIFKEKNLGKETMPNSSSVGVAKKDEKHIIDWTSGVGITVLSVIGAGLIFSRGVQKNSSKYLNKMKDYLQNKLELSTYEDSRHKAKFYEYSIRRINSFIRKSESINNITSIKDILFMKFMYKTNPTRKIHDAISNYFEKISRKTVVKSYQKTEKRFIKMNSVFNNLDEMILKDSPDEIIEYKGQKYTKKELVEKARGYRETARVVVNSFIDKNTQERRYQYMNDVTSSLYSKFWDVSFKDFWSKDNKFKRKEMWQTFIAAEQIKGDKTSLIENINYAREILAYTNQYRIDLINHNIRQLDTLIALDDKEGFEIVQKLDYLIKNPRSIVENKEVLLKELDKLENLNISKGISEEVAKVKEEYKKSCIDVIKKQISDEGTGELQDMLSIYSKIAPYELTKSGADNALRKAVVSFDESVNLECAELFDKIRDLRLGSAPTDVLTILVSFVMISFGLGHAKNSDERRSIMLTSGIPIAGAIATSIISATKLVSGGRSLALGLISGIILNKLGKITDNGFKYYKQNLEKNKK